MVKQNCDMQLVFESVNYAVLFRDSVSQLYDDIVLGCPRSPGVSSVKYAFLKLPSYLKIPLSSRLSSNFPSHFAIFAFDIDGN